MNQLCEQRQEQCLQTIRSEQLVSSLKNNVAIVNDKIITCFYTCFKAGFMQWAMIMYKNLPLSFITSIAELAFTDGVIKFKDVVAKDGFYGSKANVRTLIYSFCKNKMLEHLQNEKRINNKNEKIVQGLLLHNTESDEQTPSFLEKETLYHCLEQAMTKLNDQDRLIIEWRHLQGKSNEEIAQMLGIETASATNRIYRCMKLLKDLTQKEILNDR